jgi:hypothetical protein
MSAHGGNGQTVAKNKSLALIATHSKFETLLAMDGTKFAPPDLPGQTG